MYDDKDEDDDDDRAVIWYNDMYRQALQWDLSIEQSIIQHPAHSSQKETGSKTSSVYTVYIV